MRITFSIVLVTILLWSPEMVLAATDQEKFQNRVGKSAPELQDVTPPVVCVCKDGSEQNNHAGQLQQSVVSAGGGRHAVAVICLILRFEAEQLVGTGSCSVWELLPK